MKRIRGRIKVSDNNTTYVGSGAGAVISTVLSWALNHSVGWAIFHFFCGWFYVLYALLVRTREILPALRAMFGA